MQRFDLISPRPRKDGKTFWKNIGAGFPRDKGGFSLSFDALPLPDAEGRVTVLMVEAKPKESQPDVDIGQGGGGDIANEAIPFAMEWRV